MSIVASVWSIRSVVGRDRPRSMPRDSIVELADLPHRRGAVDHAGLRNDVAGVQIEHPAMDVGPASLAPGLRNDIGLAQVIDLFSN